MKHNGLLTLYFSIIPKYLIPGLPPGIHYFYPSSSRKLHPSTNLAPCHIVEWMPAFARMTYNKCGSFRAYLPHLGILKQLSTGPNQRTELAHSES